MFISAPQGKAASPGKVLVSGPSVSGQGGDKNASCRPGFLKVVFLALCFIYMLTFENKAVLGITQRDHQTNISHISPLSGREIDMLTPGISTKAVARELNVNFSTISRLQRRFRKYGETFNRSHNRRPLVTTAAQDLHIRLLHLRDRLRPATRTAEEIEEYFCLIKSFCEEKLILIGWAWLPL
jgi:hypothetical protein